MLDFGASDGHSNGLDFGDVTAYEGDVSYLIGMWLAEDASAASARFVFADGRLTVNSDNGYGLEWGTNTARVRHGDGSLLGAVDFTADVSDGNPHSIFYFWNKASGYVRFYFDGSLVSQTSFTKSKNTNALSFVLGNNSDINDGYACDIGQFMLWHNFEPSSSEADLLAAIYHAHQFIPRADKLTLWHKGTASPGQDEIQGTIPSASGTVATASAAPDSYYQSSLEQHRTVASHRLLRRRTDEQIFSLTVKLEFLALENMDLMNVSHDGMPLSATRLSDVMLMDVWRRFIGRVVGMDINPLQRVVNLKFKDHESFMATYWSTDVYPSGTNVKRDGLARLNVGAVHTMDRNSIGYMEQENNVKLEVSQEEDGQYYRAVNVGNEKINHIGLLLEESADNPVLNSAAKNSETNWSGTAGGGTLDTSTLRLAYPATVTDRSWRFARSDDASDTYRTQTIAVVSADTERRIYITKSEEDSTTILSWRLQRDSDSFYWNDSTPGWQSGATWNNLSNDYDSTNSLSIITREHSDIINISSNQNWTLDMGLEGASLPSGGGEGNIYSIGALKGHFVLSDIPTDAATVTASEDTSYHVKSSGSQIVSALRGTLTFQLEAIQDGGDLNDGEELCLFYWQYGSTAGQDYDAVIYEKQSSETVRFSYVRYISGSQDARAYYEVSISPGTIYDVTAVWTDDTNGELGEANSLMRIYVDGTQGTDDTASANHDDTETHTELWTGCAPDATGYLRSMNYTRYPRFWTRPFTVEEVPT